MGPSPNALSAPPLAAGHRCQASRIVSTKAPKTEPFLPSLFLSLSLYLCVCVLCFCGYRERGCCACEGFWVLLCFVFKGGFFLGGFVVWRIGQVSKTGLVRGTIVVCWVHRPRVVFVQTTDNI